MALLLISDMLLGKQGESLDFIEHACTLILTNFKSTALDQASQEQLCELLDLISKLVSELQDAVFECSHEFRLVLEDVCYPSLATCQDSSKESPGGIKDITSKICHSACRLVAVVLQKSKDGDQVAITIISEIRFTISRYLEDAKVVTSTLESEETGSCHEGAVIPEDGKLSIFAILEILDSLLATSTESFLAKLLTAEWYQEFTQCAVDILEVGEPAVCAGLCSILTRKGVSSGQVIEQVWQKVQSIFHKPERDPNMFNDKSSNIYLVLCMLTDCLLTPDVSSLHSDAVFWEIVREGLLHHRDPLTRKRAIFLLKRALEVASVKGESFCVGDCSGVRGDDEDVKFPLVSWNPEKREKLLEVWNDFFLLYEALDEVQIHVVQPVLPKWMHLLEAAIPDDAGEVLLNTQWMTLLLERSFKHESKTITRWGMEQTLKMDVYKFPLMTQNGDKFIFGSFLSTLREDYIYMRPKDAPVAQRPDVACQLEAFFAGCMNQLSCERRKDFVSNLADSMCNLLWGPVPLMLLTEVLSRLPKCAAWGTQQLYAFRELLQSSVSVFGPSFRNCIQTFLTLASMNFVDTSKVSLHEYFTFLAVLNSPGPIRRGDQIWTQMCVWLQSNTDIHSGDMSSSVDKTFINDLKESLNGNDFSAEDNGSLFHDVEVKRLALQLLALSDAQRTLLQENKRSQTTHFTSLSLPLQDVLCCMGSHVYLPTGKADRTIQVIASVINTVLDSDFSISEDPIVTELTTLLCNSTSEVFMFLKRRLLSLDSSKVTSLNEVHTYLELLNALDNYAKSVKVVQISQELSGFMKESVLGGCQRILTSTEDAQSQVTLFQAYVAMEMVCWQLQHSHRGEAIFRRQDFFLKILNLEIKTLHDSKNFPAEEKQNRGPLIGLFLGRKWTCVQMFLEAGHVTVDSETLQRCINELSLVSDAHSKLIVNCAALLVRKLSTSSPELCCEAITASWCCVQDLYRNKLFWEVYSSFVKLAFQVELMKEGPESPIFQGLHKTVEFILSKGESRLGLVNAVIANICKTWQSLLSDGSSVEKVVSAASNHLYLLRKAILFGSLRKEGRLREEMLLYLSRNSSLGDFGDRLKVSHFERDPALVRVSLINLIIRLGETKSKKAQTFLVDLFESLLEEDKAVTPKGKCYVINSHVHRIKQRLWQAALVMVNYLPEAQIFTESVNGRINLCVRSFVLNWTLIRLLVGSQCAELDTTTLVQYFLHRIVLHFKEQASTLFHQVLLQLTNENQSSAKHMMEWLVVLMIHRFPSTVSQFWARLDEMVKSSRSGFSPILVIISHLGSVQSSRDDKIALYTKAIPIIFPWSMAPTVSLRVQSQVSLYKIWLDCNQDGLSEVLEKFPSLNTSMAYNQIRGSSITNKMEGNFFLKDFHPLLDYSIETIFQTLPYLTLVIEDELVLPDYFSQDDADVWSNGCASIPLFNQRGVLRSAQRLGKAAQKQNIIVTPGSSVDLNVIDFKEKPLNLGGDVQKKITPLREDLAPGFGDSQSSTEGKRGQLVVVASLVDRMPNLGGLCRTSEIFGVEKLIIGSARYLEDKSFLGLSVTAERWLPMKEVRPSELKDYLTEMRHHGYTLVGVEQTANSVKMTDYKFPTKSLLLLGNERTGIPVELIHHLDVCVEIPQLGYIRSLNVHVSGALVVWEYTKQQMLGL